MVLSWDIIIWTKEDTTDLVPSVWGNPEKTLYKYPVGPGISEEVKNQLVLKCDDLESSYQAYPACCKMPGVTSYERALQLVNKLEDTSNLESEEESASDSQPVPNIQPTPKRRKIVPASKKNSLELTVNKQWDRPCINSGKSMPNSSFVCLKNDCQKFFIY